MIRALGLLLCLTPLPVSSQGAPPNAASPLGVNIAYVADWASQLPFIDGFKSSRSWITQCDAGVQPDCTGWDTGEAHLLDLDAHGWVRSLPRPEDPPRYWYVATLLFWGLDGHYPAGDYVVLYDGEGLIEYGAAATRNAALSVPGRDVVSVDPTRGGVYLRIRSTDPNGTGNYIRNIRFIMPGFAATYDSAVFNPQFLDRIALFKVLRLMNWVIPIFSQLPGAPNLAAHEEWASRPRLTDARYSGQSGVPLELMIDLSNRVQADPWFSLPHRASDDYARQFALLVRDRLDPERRVYLEYSNEVWNTGYVQSSWVAQQGEAAWPGGSASWYTKLINWYGLRTAQLCDIWKEVFAAEPDRVVCVMGAQAANSWTAAEALACPMWMAGAPCAGHGIGAVAIAPYFGGYLGSPANESVVQAWTAEVDGGLDKIFQELSDGGLLGGSPAGGAVAGVQQWIASHAAVAGAYGLDLISYEGGQHLVGYNGVQNNAAVTALFIAANRDPRMGDLYRRYLDLWRAYGRLFVHFLDVERSSRDGSWGALEYVDQGSAPKYDALLGFVADNPCWWSGCGAAPAGPATATPTPTPAGPDWTPTPEATATPPRRYIRGQVRSHRGGFPVPGATLRLAGSAQQSAATDSDGWFELADLQDGWWTVVAAKDDRAGGGAVSSLDAAYVLQALVGRRDLDPMQVLACDATGNGAISSLDASRILQLVVGRRERLPVAEKCGSDWVFVPAAAPVPNQRVIDAAPAASPCQNGGIAFEPLQLSVDDQSLMGLPFGDCTGNWQPSGASTAFSSDARPVLRFGSWHRTGPSTVRVGLFARARNGFQSLEAELAYDPLRLRPIAVRRTRRTRGAILQVETSSPGIIKLAFAAAEPLPRGGRLLVLDFAVLDDRKPPAIEVAGAAIDERPATR